MHVIALLVTNPKSPLLEEPGEDSFNYATVLSQSTSMFGVSLCNPWDYSLGSQGSTNFFVSIVSPIRVKLSWPFAPSPTRSLDGWNRIHQGNRQLGVMDIGTGLNHRVRDTFDIAYDMPFEQYFPRSVGLGPVFAPQKALSPNCHPKRLWTNQSGLQNQAHPAELARLFARPPKPANHEGAASKSSHFRIPVPEVATPRQCQYGQRTECLSGPNDPTLWDDHLWGEAVQAAEGA